MEWHSEEYEDLETGRNKKECERWVFVGEGD